MKQFKLFSHLACCLRYSGIFHGHHRGVTLSRALCWLFLSLLPLVGQGVEISRLDVSLRPGERILDISYDLEGHPWEHIEITFFFTPGDGDELKQIIWGPLTGDFHLRQSPGKNKSIQLNLQKYEIQWELYPNATIELVAKGAILSDMVYVEGGHLPARQGLPAITVDSFYISRHEMTIGESDAMENLTASNLWFETGLGCQVNHPAPVGSFYRSRILANLRSEAEGLRPVYIDESGTPLHRGHYVAEGLMDPEANGYRLPTEDEWLFAARGGLKGQSSRYSGGDNIWDLGWWNENNEFNECSTPSKRGPMRVGLKKPNALGLYDMSGNVAEIVADRYAERGSLYNRVMGGSVEHSSEYLELAGPLVLNYRDGSPKYMGLRLVRDVREPVPAAPLPSEHSRRVENLTLDLREPPSPWSEGVRHGNWVNIPYVGWVYEGEWLLLPWFGWFVNYENGWIYHVEHGYIYSSSTDASRFYIYDRTLQAWAYTGTDLYPWLYYFDPFEAWLRYAGHGTPGGRWFYNDRVSSWEIEGKITERAESLIRIHGGNLPALSDLGPLTVSPFSIGKHEVTLNLWQIVSSWSAQNGYDLAGQGQGCGLNHPVHSVNWFDALKWCNARSEMEGFLPVYHLDGLPFRSGEAEQQGGANAIQIAPQANGYRLPTEAQWEFAARGANPLPFDDFSGGFIWDVAVTYSNAWNADCPLHDGRGTQPVGSLSPNQLGIYDMSGNVYEWCWDASREQTRAVRGGSWFSIEDAAANQNRFQLPPQTRWFDVGFRVTR